jgi:cell division septum initiation protein DivIVA
MRRQSKTRASFLVVGLFFAGIILFLAFSFESFKKQQFAVEQELREENKDLKAQVGNLQGQILQHEDVHKSVNFIISGAASETDQTRSAAKRDFSVSIRELEKIKSSVESLIIKFRDFSQTMDESLQKQRQDMEQVAQKTHDAVRGKSVTP